LVKSALVLELLGLGLTFGGRKLTPLHNSSVAYTSRKLQQKAQNFK